MRLSNRIIGVSTIGIVVTSVILKYSPQNSALQGVLISCLAGFLVTIPVTMLNKQSCKREAMEQLYQGMKDLYYSLNIMREYALFLHETSLNLYKIVQEGHTGGYLSENDCMERLCEIAHFAGVTALAIVSAESRVRANSQVAEKSMGVSQYMEELEKYIVSLSEMLHLVYELTTQYRDRTRDTETTTDSLDLYKYSVFDMNLVAYLRTIAGIDLIRGVDELLVTYEEVLGV